MSTEDEATVELPELDSYALADEWAAWRGSGLNAFPRYLEEHYTDVDVTWCVAWRCYTPILSGDETDTVDGAVCEACSSNYYSCDRCGDLSTDSEDISGDSWCNDCRDSWAQYCDECEMHYNADRDASHNHEPEACTYGTYAGECESPALAFTVTMADGSSLAQDELTTVVLEEGEISDEGMRAINRAIADADVGEQYDAYAPCAMDGCTCHKSYRYPLIPVRQGLEAAIGRKWQDKGGNFTKRLSSYAYREHKVKLPTDLLGKIGTIAREHSQGKTYTVALTRNVNGDAGADWVHEDSCWFQSYFEGRCALKSNGGMGLRAFDEEGTPIARAWLMPIRRTDKVYPYDGWTPTFNTETPDAWLVFNGYVDGSRGWGQAPARILASMLGMSYGKVASLYSSPMYVNGNTGYIVGAADVIAGVESVSMSMDDHSSLYRTEQVTLVSA